MSRRADPHPQSLPLLIAAACLAAGVCLFFGNTLPALREGEALTGVEDELAQSQQRYELACEAARLSGAGNPEDGIDLQSLLVAIDEQGMTISEFCAAYPVEDSGPGATTR